MHRSRRHSRNDRPSLAWQLERLDPNPEYWEGKRGACVGVFQQIIARRERKEVLREVLAMLKSTRNPQVEYLARVMKKWARENGVNT